MVFGLFDRWKSKNILAILLVLHTSFLPSAYAYDENDGHDHDDDGRIEIFDDEPFVITPGEDAYEGHIDGDCVGSGCDERDDDRDGGYGDYDDDGPDYDDDHHDSSDTGHEGKEDDRDLESVSEDRGSSTSNSVPRIERHVIARQDSDRGDGVIFAKDSSGTVYYPGAFGHKNLYERLDETLFVKSVDGKSFLPLEGIKDCAPVFNCADFGYRPDWWNYPDYIDYEDGAHAGYYWDLAQFTEKQLAIKTSIATARVAYQNDAGKIKVLNEAKYFLEKAERAYTGHAEEQAHVFQQASLEIVKTIADIGIGISPLGWGKDVYEFITGKSIVDGRELSQTERILAAAGVVMPGAAGLAFAGIKIVARHPFAKTGINSAVKSYDKISDLLGSMKVARFKEGKDLSEVAVIGRDMGTVREAADKLQLSGIKVVTFEPSLEASVGLGKLNGGTRVSYDEVPTTSMYEENMSWVDEIVKNEVTVIDIGNPKKLVERSRFYDDEVLNIFGEVNKL
ncbi:hypothetical protein AZI87_02610 [Bdellovibrio bacteriovorus]|uniref:Pre-toxin TG domain-containing protein n=1 Tax=Bdellovibrio bacteriovorus TaxID=959 RepID=A0A162GHM2_BDEBC|nr:pre-toxin TG domain-containing protein [Bdellovibrio bacteriovorus]KYG68170.1 hypothetical protein AZI87_02610 [Bdellovibrio bacteriovorus]